MPRLATAPARWPRATRGGAGAAARAAGARPNTGRGRGRARGRGAPGPRAVEERVEAAEAQEEAEDAIDWTDTSTFEHAPGVGLNGWLIEGSEEFARVEEVLGVRVATLEDGRLNLQYHVRWADDFADSWEHHQALAEDIVRDFEESWFEALREGDADTIRSKLSGTGCPRVVLPRLIDKDGRVALHYAAGKGDAAITEMLLSCPGQALVCPSSDAAADAATTATTDADGRLLATLPGDAYLNLRDTLGYTPLHMAAGYGHVGILNKLLEAGGDPEIEDNKGNTVLSLVEDLRRSMPTDSPQAYSRRVALDGVLKVALESIYDEVEPVAVLEKRQPEPEAVVLGAPSQPEYLVRLPRAATAAEHGHSASDGASYEDVWMRSDDVAPDLRLAFDSGLEVAYATRVTGKRTRPAPGGKGTITEYLVSWEDGSPDSWEPEDRVASPVADTFEREIRALKRAGSDGVRVTKLGTFLV